MRIAVGVQRHCCIERSHAILTVGSPVNRCVDPFEGLRQGACDPSEGRHQGLEGDPYRKIFRQDHRRPLNATVPVTVYRWVQRFTQLFAAAARPCRHATGDRWFVDETYVKVAGRWRYLYRAVDQFGQVIDVLLSERRDIPAARRFFVGRCVTGLHRSR